MCIIDLQGYYEIIISLNIDAVNLESSYSVLQMLLAKYAEMPSEAWVSLFCFITSQICTEYSHHECEKFLKRGLDRCCWQSTMLQREPKDRYFLTAS
jgi:hypothetical protein